MVKASRSGSQKAGSNDAQAPENTQAQPTSQSATAATTGVPGQKKGKQSGKSHQPKIGGTAVAGAKSTQAKELTTTSASNQQAEYYNRDTRRRMEQMGTGPYSERAVVNPRERRQKRKERLQERQERVKHIVNARGPSRDVKLGRRNTFFLIGIAAFIIILIAAFIIIRHPF